jgi:arylsulfatase
MTVVDDNTSDAAISFIRDAHEAGTPWFVWWNGTRMHFRTHVKEELRGISGQNEYSDGMVEHDMHVASSSKSSRNWASRTTPSCSTPPITGRT